MNTFLLYSDVDQGIIDKMANQVPDSNKRLRAVIDELNDLQIKHDIFNAVREKSISIITDGSTAYDLSVLVTDNDVKSIKDFNLGTGENAGSDIFSYLDLPEFTRKVEGGLRGNYYTLYIKDGVQYLNVLTYDPSPTAVTVKMLYHTRFQAISATNVFTEKPTTAAGMKILLPASFKELVVLGAVIRLFYPAIGEDALAYLREIKDEYNDKKTSFGLVEAKAPSKIVRKFSLRKQY